MRPPAAGLRARARRATRTSGNSSHARRWRRRRRRSPSATARGTCRPRRCRPRRDATRLDVRRRDLAHRTELHDRGFELAMRLRECDHEAAGSAADVENALDVREVVVACGADRGRQRVRMHGGRDRGCLADSDLAGGPTVHGFLRAASLRGRLRAGGVGRAFFLQLRQGRVAVPLAHAHTHHVSPIERARLQEIQTRLVGELKDALPRHDEIERAEQTQQNAGRAHVEVEPLRESVDRRGFLRERGEDAGIVGGDDRALIHAREPQVPDAPIVGRRRFVFGHFLRPLRDARKPIITRGSASPV